MKVAVIFTFFVITIFSNCIQAQEVCPKERTNCTNHCRRYTDENKNDTCDLSEAYIRTILQKSIEPQGKIPELPAKDSLADNSKIKQAKEDLYTNTDDEKNGNSLKVIAKKNTAVSKSSPVQHGDTDILEAIVTPSNNIFNKESKSIPKNTSPYHLITMSAVVLIGYVLSIVFVTVHFIKKSSHRKFWNLILLITFLLSGLLGVFLAIQISYDLPIKNLTIYYVIHVDAGIIMAILSFIHFYWHRKYYYSMLKK